MEKEKKGKVKKSVLPIKTEKPKIGRPTLYSKELCEKICQAIATSPLGLEKICKKRDDFPTHETIRVWLYKYPEFSGLYAQAKMFQTEILVDQIIEISDDDSQDFLYDEQGNMKPNTELIARSRLKVDSRKWQAMKLIPKVYGEAAAHEVTLNENIKLKEELIRMRAELDERNKREY